MYELLFDVIIQVVATWPRDHSLQAPLSVTAGDLLTPPPYEAYTLGAFWDRDWVLKGAPPSSMTLSRPIIGIERQKVRMQAASSSDICHDIYLTIIDDPCKPGTRRCTVRETNEQLERRLINTMTELVKRISTYRLYKKTDGSTVALNPLAPGFSMPANSRQMAETLLVKQTIEIRPTHLDGVTVNDARSVSVLLTTCGCIDGPTEFTTFTRPKGLGEPKCELC